MSNYSAENIDFSRQSLLERISRPLPVLAIYPKNSLDTSLLVQIVENGSVVAIRYVSSSGTVNESVTYTGKSVQEVALEITSLNLPIAAYAIGSIPSLAQGDFLSTSSAFIELPLGFSVLDRIESKGILVRANKVAVRHKRSSKIKLIAPYSESASLPWFPRILNGSFTQEYQGNTYTFSIPEFDNQSWSSLYGKPFKDVIGVRPVSLRQDCYQLPRYPVFWNGQNITMYNGDTPIPASLIEDIDVNNGKLYIKPGTSLQEGFSVDYSYLESAYVYKDLNVNSHLTQNPLLLDKYVTFYLLPSEGNRTVRKRTIFHIISDSIEEGISSIVLEDDSIPIAILGTYNIRQLFNADKLVVLDTRSKGGGLKRLEGPESTSYEISSPLVKEGIEIEDRYDESYRFWDIGNYDGEAYPGAAVVSVNLPEELKGVMSLSEIQKKATKHLAAGVYPSMQFSKRALPGITGVSSQISCTYNLDLDEVYTKSGDALTAGSVVDSVPSTFEGAGWLVRDVNSPDSILSGDWSSFAPAAIITGISEKYIQVDKDTSAFMPYLRGPANPGISWKQREAIFEVTLGEENIRYTPWEEASTFDTTEVETGLINKKYFYLESNEVTRQYKDFELHAPFITGNLTSELEDEISTVIDNIIILQRGEATASTTYGTEIVQKYDSVTNKVSKSTSSSYLLASSLYNSIFKLNDTPLESKYYTTLDKIGEDFITSGMYETGHFIRPYSFPEDEYVNITDGTYSFVFLDKLELLADYLNLKSRKQDWEAFCDSGAYSAIELAKTLYNSSSPYISSLPVTWVYDSVSGFSGQVFPEQGDLGREYSEIASTGNYDRFYSLSVPSFLSTVLANTGEDISDSTLLNVYSGLLTTISAGVATHTNLAINDGRELDGQPTTDHWYIGHNRLGTYLGTNLFNIIKGYDYLKKYTLARGNISDITSPAGASIDDLNNMFGWIESMLDDGYDLVYHNLLRGGIAEPELAYTIFAYGWYLNNWRENYGIRGKTYTSKLLNKFEPLFSNGLKQLIKNNFNQESQPLETTTINGEPGPFAASVPSLVLYAIAEALKYDPTNWKGIAEAYFKTIKNTYSQDGLYYLDPYKSSVLPGKEEDILPGLIAMYTALASSGSISTWEPVDSNLSNLRGTEFLPQFDSYSTPPTGDWQGVINSLSFWKYYNSGDVESSLDSLYSFGINAIEVPLDYVYWREDSLSFSGKLQHLFDSCIESKLRVIPILFEGGDNPVLSGQESNYVSSFGHTGGRYYYEPITGESFVYGSDSGQSYVNQIVSAYDNNPALLAWSIVRKPVNNAQALINYNTLAYEIKSITDTPVIYNIDKNVSISEFQNPVTGSPAINPYTEGVLVTGSDVYNLVSPLYNPHFDFIGVQPDPVFNFLIDNITGQITSKPVIATNQGDGMFGDYGLNISNLEERSIPFSLSSIFVASGQSYGMLYSDDTTRNSRQLNSLIGAAKTDGVTPEGNVKQEKLFIDKYFYPTGYFPSYTVENLNNDLFYWSQRQSFSPSTSGEFFREIQILQRVQDSFDTLNYTSKWVEDRYTLEKALTLVESQFLDYYSSTWSAGNFFEDTGNYFLLDGEIDYNKYNKLIGDWGGFLYALWGKLNTNG
jgi:hypothetical protein